MSAGDTAEAAPDTGLSVATDPAIAVEWSLAARVRRLVGVEVAWLAAGVDVGEVPSTAVPDELLVLDDPVADMVIGDLVAGVDLEAVRAGLLADATPIIALVAQLRRLLPAAGDHLHAGLTSQDVLDTAMMVGVARALDRLDTLVAAAGDRCADLATTHRDTRMRGRTLLQPGRTTTFGLRAAVWLDGLAGDRDRLARARDRLAVSWGGAVGTGADQSPARVAAWGRRLGLPVPPLPWHGNRDRVHDLAGALATIAGQAASRSRDLVLLGQAEVGEVVDGAAGGSSAMPDKRNPAAAVQALAAARVAASAAGGLLSATEVELERAAGAWQAEWDLLPTLLRSTGAAVAHDLRAIEHLHVDTDAMAAHAGEDDLGRAGELVDAAVVRWRHP